MGHIPITQQRVLMACINQTDKGFLYCPAGQDFKRSHLLVSRGLLEPVHGRKGEGEEHFRPTAAGRAVFSQRAP